MVNMELFNIVEDIKKVSKAFVVYPKNVTVENATSMSKNASVLFIVNDSIFLGILEDITNFDNL